MLKLPCVTPYVYTCCANASQKIAIAHKKPNTSFSYDHANCAIANGKVRASGAGKAVLLPRYNFFGMWKDRLTTIKEELASLGSAEDRLMYLCERASDQAPLGPSECTAERKVPGCISGLWIRGATRDGKCFFSTFGDSHLVAAISSLLCDLFSGVSPDELKAQEIYPLVDTLGIESLLSLNRRHAVQKICSYIHAYANAQSPTTP